MNLVIDIGNSMTKAALFEAGELKDLATFGNNDANALKSWISQAGKIERGILSTVINLDEDTTDLFAQLPFPLLRIDENLRLPIKNCYGTPSTLGNDRLAAVVGASGLCPQRNILVIDAGTCVTYDVIDAGGNYLGGNISPGLHMRLRALHAFTSRLPLVEAEGETSLIGHSTETAIRAGVADGLRREMDGTIADLTKAYPELLVFLTGGDDFSFELTAKNEIFADRFLVLKGLNRLLDYNDAI